MTRFATFLAAAFFALLGSGHAEPLRIFIRAGAKTHGQDQDDHPRFLTEWTKMLNERGAEADGGMDWPTADQFDLSDVVVVYAPDPWDVGPEQRANIEKFIGLGGGLVVIHDGLCGHEDPAWVKRVIGGSWTYGKAKQFEGDVSLYYVDNEHPITEGASNFDLDDEMYYGLEIDPAAKILASTWTPDERGLRNGRAFPHIYNTAPQIWTWETDHHRAFVSLPGQNWKTFELPQYRAILLRGIAWAGKRENVDELCSPDELGSLRYPPGGPSRPIDELAKLVVHPEFKMQLVAAEPVVNKPIAIDWDSQGRLWVAETPEYPNGRRGMKPELAGAEWKDHGGLVAQAGKQDRPGRDKISILVNDADGGSAQRKRVFYEGLDLVTGFVFYKDGVIVTQAPDILWIRDTAGAGKADKVEVLYHGLGTFDTHAVINNPHWGLDGWIYATHGYSSSRDVTSGDGAKHFGNIGAGVIRFKPDGSAIEQYSSKGGNTWGLHVTWDNEIFWTQATSGDLLMQTLLPESLLARGKIDDTPSFKIVKKSDLTYPLMTWEQQAYRQIDWVGHFTAATGCVIYDGGSWPAEWNDSYFTTEPTINIVHHSFLTPEGISFSAAKEKGREETEFIVSRDMWFRPIQVEVGPDGALYVIDHYNQAVIHNDTRGPAHNAVNAAVRPDRDHYFGRIWRVDHQDARKIPVPDLSKASASGLIKALSSVNQSVRMTAARLLVEHGEGADELPALAADAAQPAPARVQALWILERQGRLSPESLVAAIRDADEAVAKNGLEIASQDPALAVAAGPVITSRLNDRNDRTRLAAIIALGATKASPGGRRALLDAWSAMRDPYLRSAVLEAANASPVEFVSTAVASESPGPFLGLVSAVCKDARANPEASAGIIETLGAERVETAEGVATLRHAALKGLAEGRSPAAIPAWTADLQSAFDRLLKTDDADVVLPLIAAWDKGNQMADDLKAPVDRLKSVLGDESASLEVRTQAVRSLIGVRRVDPSILPAVARLLGTRAPFDLQRRVLEEFGNAGDRATGAELVAAYPKLTPALQEIAFAQVLQKTEWTGGFVSALREKVVAFSSLGTIALDKLRHYPDARVAELAASAIDAIRGPLIQEKDLLIQRLLPQVEAGGDPVIGRELFQTTCAICHKLNGQGVNLAPDLTGIGSHPRAELLVDIVDPNREVDPSFAAFDFTMKNGDLFQGIISRENAQSVLVRDAAGDHELNKADIASRHELDRSLMPEGFEALGPAALRDILAYLQSTDSKYRIVDLRTVYDADSRRGLFQSQDLVDQTLKFKRFGTAKVGEVPFVVADPGANASGKNLVVLKGGDGFAKTYPQRVEIPVGHLQANALNFLGGVGGWAFPCCGDEKGEGLPAAKVTVKYEGGGEEEIVLKNGVEFADYARAHEVPGSKSAADLVNGQQVRFFRKALQEPGVIERLILESYDNRIAPVFVAITAENDGPRPAAPSPNLSPSDFPAQPVVKP